MPDFQVKIVTPVELQGAQALAEELERNIGKTKALGQATDELEAKLKSVKGAIENADESAKEGAKKIELSHRELREVVGATGRALGGLGDIAMATGGPLIAFITAGIAGLEKLKEYFDGVNESAARLAETISAVSNARMEATVKGFQEIQTALSAAGSEQEKLNAAYERGNSFLENTLANVESQLDGQKKINDAVEKNVQAQIDLRVQRGEISAQEGEREKQNQRFRLEQSNDAADLAKLQESIKAHQSELDQAKARVTGGADQAAVDAAKRAAVAPNADAAAAAEAVRQAQTAPIEVAGVGAYGSNKTFKDKAELEAFIAKKKGEAEDIMEGKVSDTDLAGFNAQGIFSGQGMLEHVQKQIETAEGASRSHDANINNLQKLQTNADAKAGTAKNQVEIAASQLAADQELLRSGEDRLNQLKEQLKIQTDITKQVEAQHASTAAIQDQTSVGREIQDVASGRGTALQQQEWESAQAQAAAARDRNGNIDANDVLTKTRLLESSLRGTPAANQAQHLGEMNHLLDTMLGFLQNDTVTRSMHDAIQSQVTDLRNLIQELQSQVHTNRRI